MADLDEMKTLFYQAMTQLMREKPFYFALQAQARKVFRTDVVDTACIGTEKLPGGGRQMTITVNPEYLVQIQAETQNRKDALRKIGGLIEHELLHAVFGHITGIYQFPQQYREIEDIAADFAVNSFIPREDLPEGGLFPEDYGLDPKLAMKEYYQLLRRIWEKHCQDGDGDGGGHDKNGGSNGSGNANDANNGKKGGTSDASDDANDGKKGKGKTAKDINQIAGPKNHVWENGDKSIDEKIKGMEPEDVRSIERLIRSILKKAVDECKRDGKWGDVPAGVRQLAEEYSKIPVQEIPWEYVLRNFVISASETSVAYTMNRVSKRYGTRPGVKIKDEISLYVGLDTSGSIGNAELHAFFEQIDDLMPHVAQVMVGECDCQLGREYVYHKGQHPTEVSGGGGTDMEPLVASAEKHKFDACVIFTDLCCPEFKNDYRIPVLFVSCGADASPYRRGKVVKLKLRPKDE
ncbi:MAG: hypothetical protein J6333_00775 [Planctomycetes bacterium]|nr:hypothetical protein [Planctomycetota bacterium]